MTPSEALLLLHSALAENIGLLCRVSDPERARQLFYRARRESKDATLDALQIRLVVIGEGNMVICKSVASVPAANAPAKPLQKALPGPTKSAEELDL